MVHFVVVCPHCYDGILIEQINCAIFRHGVIKATLTQISPHATKDVCCRLLENNLIFGCGKPFRVVKNNQNEYIAIVCDYV